MSKTVQAATARALDHDTGVLHMEGVYHRYGDHPAVHDVEIDVHPGEVVCLLGPSGCGKTTLLRIAAGLEVLQHGRVAINGRTVAVPGGATCRRRSAMSAWSSRTPRCSRILRSSRT
ncbi:MAG: ATP-binding cassette domain-containing protein [Arhodomonas sp.]|nr:ATP-binding cassette domain-containing protein [Arhodomonas sp.]